MPEFLKYKEAETRVEMLQESIWNLEQTIIAGEKDIQKNHHLIIEMSLAGAKAAQRKWENVNKDLAQKIAFEKAEIMALQNKLEELTK